MAQDISIGIGLEGEKEFSKALEATKNTIKQLDSSLKANAAEFDAHGKALKGDAKSAETMKKSIAAQKKYIEDLNRAIGFSTQKYGAASKKTTGYVVAQNRAREAVAKLEKQLEDADREMEELGNDAVIAGKKIESGMAGAAEKSGGPLSEIKSGIASKLGITPGMAGGAAALAAGAAAATAAVAVVGAIESVVDETAEYRRQQGFTKTNAEMAGLEWDGVQETLFGMAAITGDLDGAMEAINNLIATGIGQEDIKRAADAITGAAIAFPETMKVENIAEALQETIAGGVATGAFSELLTRSGMDVEKFNAAMKAAMGEEERRNVALSYLETTGMAAVKSKYEEENADEVEKGLSELAFQDAMAELATELLPISNALTEFKTEGVKLLTEAVAKVKEIAAWISVEHLDEMTDQAVEAVNGWMDSVREGLDSWAEEKIGSENYENLFGTEHEAGEAGTSGYTTGVNAPVANTGGYGAAAQDPANDPALQAIFQKQGEEAGTGFGEGVETGVENKGEDMNTAGSDAAQNAMNGFTGGLVEGGNAALRAGAEWVSAMNATFAQIQMPNLGGMGYLTGVNPPIAGSGYGAMAQNPGTINVTMQMDGRTFGNVAAPYVSKAMGRSAAMVKNR